MAILQTQGFTLDNSGKRIVVDPITRIEGHLRIEVNVDKDNVIRNAVSTGTMWRGLEVILKGRDPRDAWAFVERICGVCTGVHALASVRSVEDALGIKIPKNANIIRNLMHATLYAQDHLVHFYHLHALDWVDIVSALKADPNKTSEIQQSISPWPNSSPGYFREVQSRLKKFVESGQLGIFAKGYWGSPAYKLPAEVNLLATTHYLEALDFQKEIVKIQTIFGGKNPHPNWLVGGVPSPINVDGTGSVGAINMVNLNMVKDICDRTIEFVDQVYIPDLLAIAGFYKDWAKIGGGLSGQNVMSYGDFPDIPNDYSNTSMLLPSGVILGGDLKKVHDVDLKAPDQVQEWVTHSWYKYPGGDQGKGLHPFDGVTDPEFVLGPATKGTRTNIENIDENAKYSWVKSPRWKGNAVEVGPLARYVVAYARGNKEIKDQVDGVLKALDVPVTALFSTLGRTAARGLECQWSAHKMRYFYDQLIANIKAGDLATANVEKWEPSSWPKEAKGVAPLRGAARRARALGEDQGHEDRQLPVRGADDVERGAARREGADRRLRGRAAQHADGESGAAARDPAHDPQLRPVPRLRDARDVAGGRGARRGEGELTNGRGEFDEDQSRLGTGTGRPARARLRVRGAGAPLALGDGGRDAVPGRDRLPDRQPAAVDRRRGDVQLLLRLHPDDPLHRGDDLRGRVPRADLLGVRRQPFVAGDLHPARVERQLVARALRPDGVLPVPEEGIGAVGRPQPVRADRDVRDVHAGHAVHHRHRLRALLEQWGWGTTPMNLMGWVFVLFGDPQQVRTLHHLAMWYLVLFAVVHVYMVFREDIMSGQSVIGTMTNGIRMWKRAPKP